jgi:hypothetical protein
MFLTVDRFYRLKNPMLQKEFHLLSLWAEACSAKYNKSRKTELVISIYLN